MIKVTCFKVNGMLEKRVQHQKMQPSNNRVINWQTYEESIRDKDLEMGPTQRFDSFGNS